MIVAEHPRVQQSADGSGVGFRDLEGEFCSAENKYLDIRRVSNEYGMFGVRRSLQSDEGCWCSQIIGK